MASPVDDEVWRAAFAADAPPLSVVQTTRPVVLEGTLGKRGDFVLMGMNLSASLPKNSRRRRAMEPYLPWARRHFVLAGGCALYEAPRCKLALIVCPGPTPPRSAVASTRGGRSRRRRRVLVARVDRRPSALFDRSTLSRGH